MTPDTRHSVLHTDLPCLIMLSVCAMTSPLLSRQCEAVPYHPSSLSAPGAVRLLPKAHSPSRFPQRLCLLAYYNPVAFEAIGFALTPNRHQFLEGTDTGLFIAESLPIAEGPAHSRRSISADTESPLLELIQFENDIESREWISVSPRVCEDTIHLPCWLLFFTEKPLFLDGIESLQTVQEGQEAVKWSRVCFSQGKVCHS